MYCKCTKRQDSMSKLNIFVDVDSHLWQLQYISTHGLLHNEIELTPDDLGL